MLGNTLIRYEEGCTIGKQIQHGQQSGQPLEHQFSQETPIDSIRVDQEGEGEAANLSAENNNPPSPQCIDAAIQSQGKDLMQLLQMFKDASTDPLSSCTLQTPKHKTPIRKVKQVN
jgi:hypothetical protein